MKRLKGGHVVLVLIPFALIVFVEALRLVFSDLFFIFLMEKIQGVTNKTDKLFFRNIFLLFSHTNLIY